MQSFGKGPGALGGVVMRDPLIKKYMANSARGLMYSNGPSFPTIAAIKASISTLSSADGKQNEEISVAIIPIMSEQGQCHKLQQRLQEYRFRTHVVIYPAVSKEEKRVRLMLHADNKPDEIRGFVHVLMN
ncbi:hypothetical protein AAWM_04869 [Aspergillus awamori]|uniref:Aminotransferase class I/classII domain-containing protein n=1 Tax=Aspergillus awamori TaxID=105351 RepID=A0A401KRR8_ASPAW|nr:hypothetical protein AAWM_04869 [Aspergillus awamori]GKZ59571.1 hypothetical protein AnigIFM49718_005454 [Aspergillus niger]